MHADSPRHTDTDHGATHATSSSSHDVRTTIRRGIETPLHALRACLESLGKEFPADSSQTQSLRKAVGLIETVGRNVQVISALAAPHEPVPLRCTLDELARSAVRATSTSVRERVFCAVEDKGAFTCVDGPSFSRWLSHLIHASVAGRGQALLRVQVIGGKAVFTLVAGLGQESCFGNRAAPDPFRRSDDELLLRVAEQEIQRMGGTFERSTSAPGNFQLTARFPLDQPIEGAA